MNICTDETQYSMDHTVHIYAEWDVDVLQYRGDRAQSSAVSQGHHPPDRAQYCTYYDLFHKTKLHILVFALCLTLNLESWCQESIYNLSEREMHTEEAKKTDYRFFIP